MGEEGVGEKDGKEGKADARKSGAQEGILL